MAHRIFYIDWFLPTNSNFLWLDAFKRLGTTKPFDTTEKKDKLYKIISDFRPTHIHLGGSVKPTRSVNPVVLEEAMKNLGCSVSSFYGDAPYSEYDAKLAKTITMLYISNKTHVKMNHDRGLTNCAYMPCPTEPRIFNYFPSNKDIDLLFIGNNNDPKRRELLLRLQKKYNLAICGGGWNKEFHLLPPAYGTEFSKMCGKAKIALSINRTQGKGLEAYFSNRLPNTLASRIFTLQTYEPGLEDVFTNHKHLVWYHSEDELFSMIDYYLQNDKEREEIAKEGQKHIFDCMTFDHHVQRILEECCSLT